MRSENRLGVPVHVLRLAGIYGPGRNLLLKLRAGEARRIVKPGQTFNRTHVEDIAQAIGLTLAAGGRGGIWNVADEEPAPPQDVIAFAAELLGVPPPPEEPFDAADMSPTARSFYADNKRVLIEKLTSASSAFRRNIRPIAKVCARLRKQARDARLNRRAWI